MADEFDELEFGSEATQDNSESNKIEKRINKLNEKVILTAKERDELATAKEALENEKAEAVKERDFYAGFADSISKYPGANEYKDAIKEKVMSGYDIEDATIAILAKEGKFTPQVVETAMPESSPAGGSATTAMTNAGEKTPLQMTQEERRAALIELEQKGEFSIN